MKMVLRDVDCEDGMSQDNVQWLGLVLQALNLWVLLSGTFTIK
jgi:uncharacterized membrane protein